MLPLLSIFLLLLGLSHQRRSDAEQGIEAATEQPSGDLVLPERSGSEQAAKAAIEEPRAVPVSPAPDDLALLNGIGPKIAELLQANGIVTFAHLAETDVERLTEILKGAGFPSRNVNTWPEQARLAVTGRR